MKKLGLLVIPLMAMSFLVGCNDGRAFQGNPLTITCTKGPMTLHLYSLVDNDYEESYVNIKWAKNNKGPIHSENCLIPFTNDPVVILSFSLEENESISFVGDNPDGFSFLNNKEFMRNIAFSNDIETSDSEFKVSGNVMSLIDSKKYEIIEQMPSSACFMSLFAQSGVVDASELTLPCKKLTFGCYNEMFAGCSKLTKSPEELPATNIGASCYKSMFERCESLVSVPGILPATILADDCYSKMFNGCILLESAPELPAPLTETTIPSRCYREMFQGADNLKHLKVGFGSDDKWPVDANSETLTEDWLSDNDGGIFEWKGSGNPGIERSENTIPSAWEIKHY